jgi:hypothetical protein
VNKFLEIVAAIEQIALRLGALVLLLLALWGFLRRAFAM